MIYSSVGREEVAGTIEIDMGPLVGNGEVYHAYKLQGQSVTRNAQVNAFFKIYEDVQGGNKLQGTRNSIQMYQT